MSWVLVGTTALWVLALITSPSTTPLNAPPTKRQPQGGFPGLRVFPRFDLAPRNGSWLFLDLLDARDGGGVMDGDFKEGFGRGSHLIRVIPPTRAERARWWVVTLLPVVPVAVVAAFAIVSVMLWDHPTKRQSLLGLGDLEQALQAIQSGGSAANAAATVAASQSPGSLSVLALNAALPKYEWVDGAVNVPYSSKRPVVGMTASGTRIETAVRPDRGQCSFGLTITSSADPLISEDDLPGPGTYFEPANQVACAANQAPSSGWASWTQGLGSLP